MALFGVDYATVTPSASKLVADGAQFVCRYLSTYGNPKNLTAAEAQSLRQNGLHIVSVYETTATRALGGYANGVADATSALAQAKACGQPDGTPIYFAVDFDASPQEQPTINAYFAGIASVLGHGRTGAYGSFYVIKRLFDAGLIAYGWQTYAWSGGQWDPRAQLQQYANGKTFGGLSVDFNRAVADDYGQWRWAVPSPHPSPRPTDPHPEPKNQSPFRKKLWPVPVPSWFWAWAEWRRNGEETLRPVDAPRVIPAWAWVRLKAL